MTNGPWSGSQVSFLHSLEGTGTYTVVDIDLLGPTLENSPGAAVTGISVSAGSAEPGPDGLPNDSFWRGSVGTVDVIVDDAGRYHFFSGEPLFPSHHVDFNDGIPGRPVDTTVEFRNTYAP